MAVNNSLTTKKQTFSGFKQTFSGFMESPSVKNKINQMIGGKSGQRFVTSIISAVAANPTLSECDHASIISSAMLGESLKLSPSPQLGQYYLVPFNNKKTGKKEAKFVPGYKGYIQLAIRSGYYKKLNVLAIKEGELVHYDPMNEEIDVNLIQDEESREDTPTIGYFAMFEYSNGFKKTMYWSKKKMELHADKYSSAFNLADYVKLQNGEIKQADMWKFSSFWYKDFDGMALKTLIRQLISKWGIMSIDMQNAIELDVELPAQDEPTKEIDFFDMQDVDKETGEIKLGKKG